MPKEKTPTEGCLFFWWRWGESTCAAAQAASGCKAPPAPCQEPSGSIPDQTQKEIPRRGGVSLFGGDGGNRTPVRKRFLRNFSGRRRLFAFPRPCASRHARGLGSFMMHGTLKALRTHVHHLSTPHPGPWSSRVGRSLLKQRGEQRIRCSLMYKVARFMDARRIRPLFLPPHPRRNQYIPASEETRSIPFPRFA